MSFWIEEGIENVWLNDQITRIFKSWDPETFYNKNEDNTVVILEKIVQLVEKLNLDLSEIELVSIGYNGFTGPEKILSFDTGGATDADVDWIVAHEIGHVVDFLEGRLVWDEKGVIFCQELIPFDQLRGIYALFMMTRNKDILVEYHKMPHEKSANNFALVHTTKAPDSDDFIVAYESVI